MNLSMPLDMAAGGLDHVRQRLRASKTPDHIEFWPELPRTETGKLIRREARARMATR